MCDALERARTTGPSVAEVIEQANLIPPSAVETLQQTNQGTPVADALSQTVLTPLRRQTLEERMPRN